MHTVAISPSLILNVAARRLASGFSWTSRMWKGTYAKLEIIKDYKITRDKIYWHLRGSGGGTPQPFLRIRSHTRETRWRPVTRQYTQLYYTHTLKTDNPSGHLCPLVRLPKGLGVHTGNWEEWVRDKWAVCYNTFKKKS
jgi:hypothetical protein